MRQSGNWRRVDITTSLVGLLGCNWGNIMDRREGTINGENKNIKNEIGILNKIIKYKHKYIRDMVRGR